MGMRAGRLLLVGFRPLIGPSGIWEYGVEELGGVLALISPGCSIKQQDVKRRWFLDLMDRIKHKIDMQSNR